MIKVFGIGWAKTGTTTLGKCFEILGFDHQSQRLDFVRDVETGDLSRILELAKQKDTFEDWPWLILYRELDVAFPNSRFVLTKRSPETWLISYRNMLRNEGGFSSELNEIRRVLYRLPFPNVTDSQLIDLFKAHNAEVELYFRDRPNDLLIVDWELDSGWDEICRFLRKDIPDSSFPHANKGIYCKPSAHSKAIHFIKKCLLKWKPSNPH